MEILLAPCRKSTSQNQEASSWNPTSEAGTFFCCRDFFDRNALGLPRGRMITASGAHTTGLRVLKKKKVVVCYIQCVRINTQHILFPEVVRGECAYLYPLSPMESLA